MKPKVDIYLYDMSDTRLPFKDWLAYDNSGTLTITVTPDYFPNVPTGISGPNLIRWFRFNVVSQGDVAESSSAGPIFRIHGKEHARVIASSCIIHAAGSDQIV
ncbi:hypothetical protein K493DRAFT_11557 [Basidiobolus meristosporus CBS 931.73]|uniref:Uncharacterized protein n=1 Tax=Basidiobolus meristosporus CBS 931.73 TaxID=1314790 RepID=A0A1Y1YIG3_9FUNG|nr:hypothetical protein K493DRAFT_11557 [Basidiobolus meristosporus CBS 931.73]|eukprot:ORX97837.1 hypothetical protein K493DRAFT_11557 [Basidiobolus meristosporus CBS 931.73]